MTGVISTFWMYVTVKFNVGILLDRGLSVLEDPGAVMNLEAGSDPSV